jgi:hypothetical protein
LKLNVIYSRNSRYLWFKLFSWIGSNLLLISFIEVSLVFFFLFLNFNLLYCLKDIYLFFIWAIIKLDLCRIFSRLSDWRFRWISWLGLIDIRLDLLSNSKLISAWFSCISFSLWSIISEVISSPSILCITSAFCFNQYQRSSL